MDNNLLKCILCALVAVLSCACTGRPSQASGQDRAWLGMLVSILDEKEEYASHFDAETDSLRGLAEHAGNEAEAYRLNKKLYERYIWSNTDSAFVYINRNRQLAAENPDRQWMAENNLARSSAYMAAGLLREARKELESMVADSLAEDQRVAYYMRWTDYYTSEGYYRGGDFPLELAQYADSIMQLRQDPSSPEHLIARYNLRELDDQKRQETFDLLTAKVASLAEEDEWYSRLCAAAGWVAYYSGNQPVALAYFCKSLAARFKVLNRNVMELPIVASMAADMGELEYANRLMSASLSINADFPDRLRAHSMLSSASDVYNKTIDRLQTNARNSRHLLYVLCAVLVMLLVLSFLVYKMYRRQLRMRVELARQNALLAKTQTDLVEANYLKEKYIANLFEICSAQLDRHDRFVKTVGRKLTARQYDELAGQIKNLSDCHASGMREFQRTFDSIFLEIFPDFVDRFNELLQPDKRVQVNEGRLNTDLRICALIRLGIESSTQIATILYVSQQTVYNSRTKMRNNALTSDLPFVERVKRLGVPTMQDNKPSAVADDA